jgi:HSP20 family molecular chaperone IbpA
MLTKRYPPISNMFEDVIGLNNRLWSSFDHLLGMAPPIPVSLNPSVEMNEDGGKIKYLIDMPGVSISEASVVQEGNYIKVEAERAHRNTKSHFLTNFKVGTYSILRCESKGRA